MKIYENVKCACKQQNISISALEDRLGFARGSIYKWDKNTPGVDKVKAVADELGLPIEFFLREEVEDDAKAS